MWTHDRRRFLRTTLSVAAAAGLPPSRRLPRHELEDFADELVTASRIDALRGTVRRAAAGWSATDLLAGTFLAGVREVAPDPVGFKFHCVMVVPAAHDLSRLAAPEESLLPVLFNVSDFKRSQIEDAGQGDFRLGPPPDGPRPERPLQALTAALERFDLGAAEAALPAVVEGVDRDALFEELWRFGARDFHNLGHKIIFTLHVLRVWERCGDAVALPGLRSLVRGLLAGGGREPRLGSDENRELAAREPGKRVEPGESLLATLREADAAGARDLVHESRVEGVPAEWLWDELRRMAAEIHLRHPGLLAVHPLTTLSALASAAGRARRPETAELMLLTAASWSAEFRRTFESRGAGRDLRIDALEPVDDVPPDAFEEADGAKARGAALRAGASEGGTEAFLRAFRRRVGRKGDEHHYPKYVVALGEEVARARPEHRGALLAAGLSYVPAPGRPDSEVVRAFEAGELGSLR